MRRRRSSAALGIALAAAALASGCTCGSQDAKKKEEAAPAADRPADTDKDKDKDKELDSTAARRRSEALHKMRLAPLTLEEIQPLIPAPPGTSPVGKPGVLTEGRQVKAVLCMVSPSPEAAMSQLVGAVSALGFTGVKTRPHPKSAEMLALSADKHPYQLGATAQKTTTPDCPGDKGKIKLVLSYFKRVTTGATIPSPAP